VLAPVLVIIALLLQLPSPQPTPTPAKVSQEQKDERQNKSTKREGEQLAQSSPFTVTQIKPDNHKTESGEPASDKWWIVGFTGALVLFSGLQFWAMHRPAEYMRKGLRISIRQSRIATRNATASQMAADAATQSAETAKRALVATQRALIVNTEINAGVVVDDVSRQLVGFHFFAVFRNSGPTVALNAKCTASLICGFRNINGVSHDAPAPIASGGSISVGPGVIFNADPIGIALDQIDRLKNNEVAFFIHGHIEYRDIFENTPTRITSVCARITLRDDPRIHTAEGFNTKAFCFKAGPSDHNYST
jgi:hypothetical protein